MTTALLARQLFAGIVGHNASRSDFSIACGGFKPSGLGREDGIDGLLLAVPENKDSRSRYDPGIVGCTTEE